MWDSQFMMYHRCVSLEIQHLIRETYTETSSHSFLLFVYIATYHLESCPFIHQHAKQLICDSTRWAWDEESKAKQGKIKTDSRTTSWGKASYVMYICISKPVRFIHYDLILWLSQNTTCFFFSISEDYEYLLLWIFEL